MRLSHVPLAILLVLAGCEADDSTFDLAFKGGEEESFPGFETTLMDGDPLVLRTCSEDPTPELADDERTLCLRIHLDAAGLSEAGSPATLPIAGETRLSDPAGTTPTFTRAEGHSPVVSAAWATVVCYSRKREEPLVQQLEGQVVLEHNTAERLAGHVVVSATGNMMVADCGDATSAAFDFRFDVARR